MTNLRYTPLALALAFAAPIHSALAEAPEFSGSVGIEARVFPNDPLFPNQSDEFGQFSAILEAEVDWRSEDRKHQFVFMPWARIDSLDEERTHADAREFYYRYRGDAIEAQVGLIKVFWGTAESRHLVDIVNQTDGVEDIDGEDKLGQPVIRIGTQQDWGKLEGFILPYFRKQTAPGIDGRLRGPLPLDWENPTFESGDEEENIDFALRYSHYFGDWDVGLSLFNGTSREASFSPSSDGSKFIPHYAQISQFGLDVQYTNEAWLWKFEGIVREGHGDTFGAFVGGLEYTFYGLTDGGADLGILAEYQYDDREENSPLVPITTSNNDLFVGARYALNDMQDTSILAGGIIDLENGSSSGLIEAERRIGDNWKAELEARLFINTDQIDPLHFFRKDDALTFRLTRYF